MNATLTVQDLFKLILFLMGIGVGAYLIIVLRNINKLLGQVRSIAESNEKELDRTIKQLPEISENINAITKETRNTLTELAPEVNNLLTNINSISGKVENVTNLIDDTTHKVNETVDVVTDSIAETALAFSYNAKNVNNYMQIVKEIIEIIKNAFGK